MLKLVFSGEQRLWISNEDFRPVVKKNKKTKKNSEYVKLYMCLKSVGFNFPELCLEIENHDRTTADPNNCIINQKKEVSFVSYLPILYSSGLYPRCSHSLNTPSCGLPVEINEIKLYICRLALSWLSDPVSLHEGTRIPEENQ